MTFQGFESKVAFVEIHRPPSTQDANKGIKKMMNTNNKNTLVWDKAANTLRMDTYGEDDAAQKEFFKTCLNQLIDCLMTSTNEADSGNQILKALANYDDVKGDVRFVDLLRKAEGNCVIHTNCYEARTLSEILNGGRENGYEINGFMIAGERMVITLLNTGNTYGNLGKRTVRAFCELMAA